ncbi:MAG TPA: hypothetical protein VHG31_04935 [Stellaceae bacterium]|nr:hypothetical protein [Stellaceae bacterium]
MTPLLEHSKGGGQFPAAGNFSLRPPGFVGFIYFGQRLGRRSCRFPARRTGKSADPNSEATQPSREGIAAAHRRAFSRVNEGAVCNAIAAIFAAFNPVASSRRSRHSHSIVLDHGNALIFQLNFFLHTTKHRLPDPSEICALDFKRDFGRFAICSVPATIGINRPFSAFHCRRLANPSFSKNTVTRRSSFLS